MLRTFALGKVQKLQKSALPSVELLILIPLLNQNIVEDGAFRPRAPQPLWDSCTLATLAISGQTLACTCCDILWKTPSTLFFPWWYENFPAEMIDLGFGCLLLLSVFRCHLQSVLIFLGYPLLDVCLLLALPVTVSSLLCNWNATPFHAEVLFLLPCASAVFLLEQWISPHCHLP